MTKMKTKKTTRTRTRSRRQSCANQTKNSPFVQRGGHPIRPGFSEIDHKDSASDISTDRDAHARRRRAGEQCRRQLRASNDFAFRVAMEF
jgi:hypothetical protein